MSIDEMQPATAGQADFPVSADYIAIDIKSTRRGARSQPRARRDDGDAFAPDRRRPCPARHSVARGRRGGSDAVADLRHARFGASLVLVTTGRTTDAERGDDLVAAFDSDAASERQDVRQ